MKDFRTRKLMDIIKPEKFMFISSVKQCKINLIEPMGTGRR